MGIPCGHMIRDLNSVGLKVTDAHFDAYWLFTRPAAPLSIDEASTSESPARFGTIELSSIDPLLSESTKTLPPPPVVLPPLKVRSKGRPRKNDGSTRREPSAWERYGGPTSSGARNTPRPSQPRTQLTSGAINTMDTITSTPYTEIPATQYPQNDTEFVPIEKLEATLAIPATQIAITTQSTQPKKRGRPVGSKDRQPRKRKQTEVVAKRQQGVGEELATN